MRLGVVVIHGMGSQRPGFAAGLVDRVASGLKELESRLEWQEIHWAYALQDREAALWNAMKAATDPSGAEIPLDWRRVREFVVHNFGDALAYHRDPRGGSAYKRVHEIISAKLAALKTALGDPEAPVVVMAHSLGAHMMSNYIWDRQGENDSSALEALPTLTSMITFGCNIPLFSLSLDEAKPITVPAPNLDHDGLRKAARWLNFLDRDDVLGWPLRTLYEKNLDELTAAQKATVERIEDREINVGGLGTAWNPAAHAGYWEDRDMIGPVVDHLKELLEAMG